MVTDIKGDIYAANKDFRHIKRFSTTHWQDSAHFDPLVSARSMDIGARKIFLENLAITLISNDGGSESKYFTDGARDFFTGITLYLLNKDSKISLPEIIQQIVVGTFSKWVIEIKDSDDEAAKSYTNHFYGENEKNVAGTYSKLVSATRLFSSPIMHTLLSNEGVQISPADLEVCTDIYIQVDPNQMELMAPVIAMIYQTFMSAMLYRHESQNPPIAFIIDEFGQLPEMPVISQSAALLRAYNCSLLLSCQSLAMIEKHYGIAGRKLLMDCTKVHCFLSIMDPDTRDWASRLFGTRKVLKLSTSEQITAHLADLLLKQLNQSSLQTTLVICQTKRQSQSITKASTSRLKKHLSLTINLYFICHYFLRDTHRVGFPSRAKRDSLFLSLPRLGSS